MLSIPLLLTWQEHNSLPSTIGIAKSFAITCILKPKKKTRVHGDPHVKWNLDLTGFFLLWMIRKVAQSRGSGLSGLGMISGGDTRHPELKARDWRKVVDGLNGIILPAKKWHGNSSKLRRSGWKSHFNFWIYILFVSTMYIVWCDINRTLKFWTGTDAIMQ